MIDKVSKWHNACTSKGAEKATNPCIQVALRTNYGKCGKSLLSGNMQHRF